MTFFSLDIYIKGKDMERVDIKIRKEYRDMLKEYCKHSGDKMYIVVEKLIVEKCAFDKKSTMKSEKINE